MEGEEKSTVTRRNVINNWPLMTFRPRVPRKLNRIARIHAGIKPAWRRALMAIDITGAHGCRLHEPQVLVQ